MQTFINQPWYFFIKDIITFLFTGAGLVIAGMGLFTWKKQTKGVKEFDAAYNLHYSLLKLRNAIRYVRNPAIFPSESYEAMKYAKTKDPSQSDQDIEDGSHGYVYEMRWDKIVEADTEMEAHLLAAEVLWGPKILTLINPLNKKITELNISLKQFFQPTMGTKDVRDIAPIIYDHGNWNEGIEDDFSREVSTAIKGITDYIKEEIS